MTHNGLIKKILVATDGSGPSIRAAGYAAEIARCTGAEVTVLNAAEVSGVTQFVTYFTEENAGLGGEPRRTSEDIIVDTKQPFVEADIHVHSKIIEGYAPEVIIQESRDGKYDLIAMGSRGVGTGLIKRIAFGVGSVAERVIGNAPCPVLVVRE